LAIAEKQCSEDLAILTGGTVLAKSGYKLRMLTLATRAKPKKKLLYDNTTIVNGRGNKDDIKARVAKSKRKWKVLHLITIAKKMRASGRLAVV